MEIRFVQCIKWTFMSETVCIKTVQVLALMMNCLSRDSNFYLKGIKVRTKNRGIIKVKGHRGSRA